MKQLLVASNNAKKAGELRELLAPLGVEVLTLAQAGVESEVDETGEAFARNAFLKANHAYTVSGLPVLADDSGLCVDALNGAPGVLSARYGAPEAVTDADRNACLLRQMESHDNRVCRFVCCVCLILPYAPPVYFEGEVCGELLREPRGGNGFGYDPLFFVPEYGKSMAELPAEIKNQISHRALAIRQFITYIQQEGVQ